MNRIISLDIVGNSVFGLELAESGGTVRAAAAFTAELPVELTLANVARLAPWLREQLAANGIQSGRAICTLSRGHVSLRSIRVPQCPDDELPDIVRFAVNGDAIGKGVLDFHPRPSSSDEREVLVVQTAGDVAQAAAEMMKGAGLAADHIGFRPFAAQCLWKRMRHETFDGPALLINAAGGAVELAIWDGDCLVMCRSIKLDHEGDPTSRIIGEVHRTLAAHQAQDGNASVGIVGVFGEDCESLALALRAAVERTVYAYPISSGWPLPDAERADRFAAAYGAGCKELQRSHWPVDFANPKRPPVRRDRRKHVFAMIAILIVLAPISVYALVAMQMGGYSYRISQLQKDIDRYKASLNSYKPILDRHRAIKEWNSGAVNWAYELGQLAMLVPDTADAYLDSVEFTAGRKNRPPSIKLSGRVRSQDVVTRSQTQLAQDHAAHYQVTQAAKLDPGQESGDFRWRFSDLQLAILPEKSEAQLAQTSQWKEALSRLRAGKTGATRASVALRERASRRSATKAGEAPSAAPGAGVASATGPPQSAGGDDDGGDAVAKLIAKIRQMPADQREKYIETSVPAPVRARVRQMLSESPGPAAPQPPPPAATPPASVTAVTADMAPTNAPEATVKVFQEKAQ